MPDGKTTPRSVSGGDKKTKARWFRPTETRCATCRFFELTPASALYFACQAPSRPIWADDECSMWRQKDETPPHERQNDKD